MPEMVLAFLMTVVSLGAAVLMVLIFVQAQNRAAARKQEMFMKALDAGVYDRKLLGQKTKDGNALLGWGIFFVMLGFGIMIALGSAPDPMVFRNGIGGAVIPLFIGIAMIVFYSVSKKLSKGQEENGKPVVLDKDEGKAPPRGPSYGQ